MRVIRVLPDVPAVDRAFDYIATDELAADLCVGKMVRIPFGSRRVAGWVLALDVEPPVGVKLSSISKVVGCGPDQRMIDICYWAAWRWSGRLTAMFRAASPSRVVTRLPPLKVRPATTGQAHELAQSLLLLGAGTHVLQVSPTTDPLGVVVAAARLGQILAILPNPADAERVARGLRSAGAAVAQWPKEFQAAAGGASVVGGRGAAFAPLPALAAVVVIDEHDELLQSESSPTWNAREIAIQRAHQAQVPCLLVSPCPSLEALVAQHVSSDTSNAITVEREVLIPSELGTSAHLAHKPVMQLLDSRTVLEPRGRLSRTEERAGWAALMVIDRRGEDTSRTGLFSSQLVEMIRQTARSGERVVCVLNRTGRARLLACRSCGTLAECEQCNAAVFQNDAGLLVCSRCEQFRPAICLECGSQALSILRGGVSRAGEELEALTREAVQVVTGATPQELSDRGSSPASASGNRIFIGTQAVLHRVRDVSLVAFLDFDQELLAPRYRASEDALGLLMLASRRVGGRASETVGGRASETVGGRGGGQVVVQTRRPDHEALQAALQAEPVLVSLAEAPRRELLGFPPAASIALVGSVAAPEFLRRVGEPDGVEIQQSVEGQWLLRSRQLGLLQQVLHQVDRPIGRLQLQVDPARIRK
ncbi:MAG: hypothetical protein WD029_10965 [Microthrixaceae bacterium]